MKSSINLQRLQEKLRLENEKRAQNIRLLTRPMFNEFRYKLAQESLLIAMNDLGEGERFAYITLLIKSSSALNHLSLTDATISSFAKIIEKHPVPLTPYFLRRGTNITEDDMKFILQELMNMGLVKEVIQRNSLRYGMTKKLFHINNLSDPDSKNTLVAPTDADLEIQVVTKALNKRAKRKSAEEEKIEECLYNRVPKRRNALEKHQNKECDSDCRLCLLERTKDLEEQKSEESQTEQTEQLEEKEESLKNLSSQEGFQYIPASLLSEENKTASADLYTQCPICGADFKGKSLEEMEEHGKECV